MPNNTKKMQQHVDALIPALRMKMTEPIRTYLEKPSTPKIKLPAGACDAHVHVFGPAKTFPFAATSTINPVDAPKEKLFALHKQLGIDRCVIVQSAVHGLDNTVVEDAIKAGEGRYLGVALVRTDTPDSELKRLATAGFRAVRFNFMSHLGPATDPADLVGLSQRLEPLGMHLQVHFDPALIDELSPYFKRCATPVVIDHMARVDAAKGIEQPAFQSLCRLLDLPGFFVKISGIDRIDPTPPYLQGIPCAAYLATKHTERCVWGTDWPHPNHTHIPDDGTLVDALAQIASNPETLRQILVVNPQKLYRFNT